MIDVRRAIIFVSLVRGEMLLAHHPGEEAADGVSLPAGRLHRGRKQFAQAGREGAVVGVDGSHTGAVQTR
jgi:hypothetical protein